MSRERDPSGAVENEAHSGLEIAGDSRDSFATGRSSIPSVGQQLRLSREGKGLSVGDVSRTLKLSFRQVEAIEADDWPNLPCNTILRGFVRNYARLLELNPDGLMATLDGLPISSRFCTRYICLDQFEAEKELEFYRKGWQLQVFKFLDKFF